MDRPSLLTTHDLAVGYPKSRVAENINLSFGAGQLITIVGANGIGKSTLLRTLTGIQKPIYGKVLLMSKEINAYSTMERAQHLSVVLTEKLPSSHLTVQELITLGRHPYTNWIGSLAASDEAVVGQVMAITQTTPLATKKLNQISDGQLQRVLIARALAQDTSLIVLDEPTTHLDLYHKVAVYRLLRKLTRDTQKCIVFSTHDIDLAIQLADEMIVMTANEVVQDEPCNLISRGVFDTLFDDEAIQFDREKGKFVVKG